MIVRVYKSLKRRCAIFLVNKVFAGTNPHYFNIKRKLLNSIGYSIASGTKIVGPVFCTGVLTIGQNCWIGANFLVRGNGMVMLGDNIDVGPDVTFLTGTHEIGSNERRAGKGYNTCITIDSGCWIGGKSIFINKIVVGKSVVVAAGALVCKSVADNTLVGGVPAKLIKNL